MYHEICVWPKEASSFIRTTQGHNLTVIVEALFLRDFKLSGVMNSYAWLKNKGISSQVTCDF